MLYRDLLEGDVISIGGVTVEIGWRTNPRWEEYAVLLFVRGEQVAVASGSTFEFDGFKIRAIARRGACIRLGIKAPRSVPIHVLKGPRWGEKVRRQA